MYNGHRYSSRHWVRGKDKDKMKPLLCLFLMVRCRITLVRTSFRNGFVSLKCRNFSVLVCLE